MKATLSCLTYMGAHGSVHPKMDPKNIIYIYIKEIK